MKLLQRLFSITLVGVLLAVLVSSSQQRLGAEAIVTGPLPEQDSQPPKVAARSTSRDSSLPKLRLDRQDYTAEEFVARLLAEMTLEEKIGQMCQAFPGGDSLTEPDAAAIRNGEVGSIFFTGNEKQVQDAQQVAVEQSRLGIPLIVARDVIHGFRTIFPIPLGQAASWNPKLVKQAAEVAASESRRVGIHWTFAPMVDVSRDPRWGRIAESCGEDSVLASALGGAMVEGFQMGDSEGHLSGIAACPKHYIAYGLAEGGRDYNSVMLSRNELRNVYLPPFKACVDAGALSLMTAFNTINGVPASGHQRLLRQTLKNDLGFAGLVVSDWGSVPEMMAHGYVADKKQAAHRSLQAGVDMEMVTTCYKENLRDLLSTNDIQMEMIDDAVRRTLLAKLKLDLFAEPYADDTQPLLLADSHRQVARELAQQSLVLLKNDDVLPLNKKKLTNVAVIGPLAEAAQDQLGCWVQDADAGDSVTPLVALKQAFGDGVRVDHVACDQTKYQEADTEIEAALAAAQAADVVLLFVGEPQELSGEAHSRTNLSLPGSQAQLVAALAELDVPVVMVVLAGRPLTIGEQVEQADAVIYAWHPGTMGGPAIADVLLGSVAPSGKLPVTFPKVTGQVPLYYNHLSTGRPPASDYRAPALDEVDDLPNNIRYTSHYIDSDPFPLFPFGFGLTYTKFDYQDLELSTQSLGKGQTLAVRVRVQNVGTLPAVETVQLYTRDTVASIVRPVKELKNFRRIEIQPGEAKVVEFALPYESLGFFNEQEQYVVEPGEIKIAVGGSSATVLSGVVTIQ